MGTLRNLTWEPLLGLGTWEPLLGNLGTLTWEPGNLYLEPGNLGGMGFGAAPVCSETFTMAEDTKAFCCWGKKLIQVLQWLSVPQNIIQVVQNIDREAKFRVTKGEHFPSCRTQDSGIRQGCPLSPYLFSITMTALFQDIRATLNTPKQQEPIKGIQFAEVH